MSENYICLDGKKIKISDETAKTLRKEVGEYQFKHGDIATVSGCKRIIIDDCNKLISYCSNGCIGSIGQESFVRHGYKKIGSVFDN